jgi:SRSO17 transposase
LRTKRATRRAKSKPEWEVEEGVVAGVLGRLRAFLESFAEAFVRREQSAHALTYVAGRLRPLRRRTIEPIATAQGEQRRPLQKFVGAAPWDDEAAMREQRRQVARELGSPDGVLIVDSSGFQKKGTKSVGVKRQYLGRLGKQENCQVGEFVAYAAKGSHVLVDRRLYLPKEWAADRDRRAECYVPREVEFKTGPQLAVEMVVKHCREIPHRWVVGDDTYGRCKETRDALQRAKEQYLLEAPENTQVELVGRKGRRTGEVLSASAWAAQQVPKRWRKYRVRDGEKGPIQALAIRTRVYTKRDSPRKGRHETLCVVKRLGKDAKTWYYLSGTVKGVSLGEMVRAASCRHAVEESIELAKGDTGLAEYEVRSWIGWHHHVTLCILAQWFIVREHRRGKKTPRLSPSRRFAGWSASSSTIPIDRSATSRAWSASSLNATKTPGGFIGGHDSSVRPRGACASALGVDSIDDSENHP